MNKKLIFLVGATGSGKDTVADRLHYNKVISYKAGPMRNTDIQGVTHHFISDEEMDILELRDDLIAHTKIGDIRYCATADQLNDDVMVYIINPDGIEWFKKNYNKGDIDTYTIYLYVPLRIRRARCKNRSDYDTMFDKRTTAEKAEYSNLVSSGNYDALIHNSNINQTVMEIEDKLQQWFAKSYR